MVGRLPQNCFCLFFISHGLEDVMLVLSRKKGESLMIRDDIVITVVEIRGDKVRLGIEAPKEVPVNRREVFDALQRRGETHVHGALRGRPLDDDGAIEFEKKS
jgi:carbon storage regulator